MEFMTIEELQKTLRIGRNAAYDLCKKTDFPCLKINKTLRIPKDEFNEWCKVNMYNKPKIDDDIYLYI